MITDGFLSLGRSHENFARMNTLGLFRMAACAVALVGVRESTALATESSQTKADDSLPSITVIAPRPPDPTELANDSVPRFIQAHARPAIVTGQLSRWRDGICPVTTGLSPGFNRFISARILAIAGNVGAPHQTAEHCMPNVRIFFTTEPEKLIHDVEKRAPALLGFHYPQQTRTLATFSHPIQGWYVTATQGDDGSISRDDAMPIQVGTPWRPLEAGTVPAGRLGSRLSTGIDSLIVSVIIIADTTKVAGYTAGSISDYLAMLVLSQTRSPDTCGRLPSILDLMVLHCATENKPDSVTAGDLAFLHALYSTDLREGLPLEQSELQDKMVQAFSTHK